jgi:hypothetical protein
MGDLFGTPPGPPAINVKMQLNNPSVCFLKRDI